MTDYGDVAEEGGIRFIGRAVVVVVVRIGMISGVGRLRVLVVLVVLVGVIGREAYGVYVHGPGTCMMYGQCGSDNQGRPLNCLDNGGARAVPGDEGGEFLSLIGELCPTLAGEGTFCCDLAQLRTMKTSVQAAIGFLSACPACTKNFLNLWCQMT